MFAALFGAVLSSLDSMLNSASTIFTMDIYKQLVNKDANPKKLLNVGRIMTGVFVLIACFIAPLLNDPKFGGIFKYIQMFQGFISPGILVVFVFGIFSTRCPPKAASIGLLMNIPIYGLLLYLMPNSSFLNHMSITFSLIAVVMAAITWANPLTEPKKLPVKNNIDLENHPAVKIWSIAIIAITIGFYIIFW